MIMMFYADESGMEVRVGLAFVGNFSFSFPERGGVILFLFFTLDTLIVFCDLIHLLGSSGHVCTTCTKIVSTVFPLLRRVTTSKKK